jgi:PST family polysaccharide transporter
MVQLGFYEKSYRLMMLPLSNITNVLTPVMHPVFSEMQHDGGKMLHNYMRVVRWLAMVGFPLSAVLFFGARETMLLIFGMQWVPSVPTFQILALTVGIQVVLSSSGPVFQAAGDTRSLFVAGLTSAITNVGGLLVALTVWGTIEAVAWAMLISFSVNFLICYLLMYRVTFRAPMDGFWRQFPAPLMLTAVIAAALWGVECLTREWSGVLEANTAMILSLGAKCLAAGVMWAGWVQISGEFDIIGKVKSMLHRR